MAVELSPLNLASQEEEKPSGLTESTFIEGPKLAQSKLSAHPWTDHPERDRSRRDQVPFLERAQDGTYQARQLGGEQLSSQKGNHEKKENWILGRGNSVSLPHLLCDVVGTLSARGQRRVSAWWALQRHGHSGRHCREKLLQTAREGRGCVPGCPCQQRWQQARDRWPPFHVITRTHAQGRQAWLSLPARQLATGFT